MKFTTALVFAVAAGLASALPDEKRQAIPNYPPCALNCFVTALSGDGCSSIVDYACQCKKTDRTNQVAACVQNACPNPADQSTVSSLVVSACSAAGVPISVPPVNAGGSSAPTTSPSSAASSTTGKSSAKTTAAGPTGSASARSSSAGSSSARPSGSNSTTPTGQPFKGGAAPAQVPLGVVAAGLAALAL